MDDEDNESATSGEYSDIPNLASLSEDSDEYGD